MVRPFITRKHTQPRVLPDERVERRLVVCGEGQGPWRGTSARGDQVCREGHAAQLRRGRMQGDLLLMVWRCDPAAEDRRKRGLDRRRRDRVHPETRGDAGSCAAGLEMSEKHISLRNTRCLIILGHSIAKSHSGRLVQIRPPFFIGQSDQKKVASISSIQSLYRWWT